MKLMFNAYLNFLMPIKLSNLYSFRIFKIIMYEFTIIIEIEFFENAKIQFRYEKEVDKTQRNIAKVEDNLDENISSQKTTQDKLELIDKDVVDAELQVGALKRRIALLEEETSRSATRLNENLAKIVIIEKVFKIFLQRETISKAANSLLTENVQIRRKFFTKNSGDDEHLSILALLENEKKRVGPQNDATNSPFA